METSTVHRSPFHSFHAEAGAHFTEFAGWEMPLHYGSIVAEHQQVRTAGGLFDVSHMGRIQVQGRHARRLLERALTRRISDMAPGTCRYSLVCNERGGIMDDLIVYRFEDSWLLVTNAVNREKILQHLKQLAADLVVEIQDQTFQTGMVALQGPRVMEMIARFSREIPSLKRFSFCVKNLLVLKMTISRTGYSGEDGVEVILPATMASMAVKLLLKNPAAGPEAQQLLRPAGLGARDTLRIEAGLPLYGQELSEEIDPFSADLGWAVNLDKDQDPNGQPFVGQNALKSLVASGPRQKRVGLQLEGRRTPRTGMRVLAGDQPVGRVTSGCLSPTLGYPIAMAYVDLPYAQPGTALAVQLGSGPVPAQVVALPFYRRPST